MNQLMSLHLTPANSTRWVLRRALIFRSVAECPPFGVVRVFLALFQIRTEGPPVRLCAPETGQNLVLRRLVVLNFLILLIT
jgi:hypothetical protein